MTIAELLALVGRAWSRLALYPGGLAALAALWLAASFTGRLERAARPASQQRAGGYRLLHAALPWLAVALIPLPYAVGLSRPLDLAAALALLEWPRVLAAAEDLRGGLRERGVRRLAAMLNGYPPLVLAALVLAQGAGSLELGLIGAAPLAEAPLTTRILYWAGAAALALALPPLLEVGPFDPAPQRQAEDLPHPLHAALRLRALGLVLVASLPWLELLPPAREDGAPAWWLVPLPPLVIALLVWGFGRATAGRQMRRWAKAWLALCAALLGLLLYAGYAALSARIS